jgi:ankyrin repeat protein
MANVSAKLLLDDVIIHLLTLLRSPLNTAFLYGHAEIVRMLLKAEADLNYVNKRTWTSPRYIFDSGVFKRDTSELLDICLSNGFNDWNIPDTLGWTILHRAAAFGQGQDVTRLLHLGASTVAKTSVMNWLPIQCAAQYGNLSTFNVLAEKIPAKALICLTDSRGWTVLHLAAENRTLALLVNLLERGLNPNTKSSASSLSVPRGLERVEATPRDVARACENEEVYLQALRIAKIKD